MYANLKGNSGWNKGSGKKERPFCTHCNMPGHTFEKCYKLHGYPPGYKPKRKSTTNANPVSSNPGNVVAAKNASVVASQCPISKAQCEQLLAYLTSGNGLGDAHHRANVSTSSVEGVFGVVTDMVSISSQPKANFTSNSALMSGIHPSLPLNPTLPFTPNLEHYFFFC